MTDVIKIYRNEENRTGFRVKDFLSWDDYRILSDAEYFDLLFPVLNKEEIRTFQTDGQIRRNLLKVFQRVLLYCGFALENKPVFLRQVRRIKRRELGSYVGLYDEEIYPKLTRIMTFLQVLGYVFLAILLILAVCYAMKKHPILEAKIESLGELTKWKEMAKRKIVKERWDDSDEEEEEEENDDCPFRGLEYNSNSCYQDSTLLALFAKPIDFIDRAILDKDISEEKLRCDVSDAKSIQKELANITDRMRGKQASRCTNLRNLIRRCPGSQAFHGTGTQDAGEFLNYLFDLFNVHGTIRQRTTIATNDLSERPRTFVKVSEVKEDTSPVVMIPNFTLEMNSKSDLKSFLEQQEDAQFDKDNLYKREGKTYRRRIETTKILSSEFLVFYAIRAVPGGKRNFSALIPPEIISLRRKLHLYAIVVHQNNHYTCYIRCGRIWYYYNDLRSGMKKIGNYEEMLEQNPSPTTEGNLYFYC